MMTHEDNEALCRVGPGTLMGDLLRRYWYPVLSADELSGSGSGPKRVRLLGQNLVAFRDSGSNLGLLDELCPHRGASLALGRNEECGLRCLYHGWKIGTDGTVLETPNEPEDSRFKERFKQPAYQLREAGGLLWAYLGPAESEPPLPAFEWTSMDESHVGIIRVKVNCNWVQVLEGLLDSSHSSWLHSNAIRPSSSTMSVDGGSQFQREENTFALRPSNDRRPRLDVQDTPYGFRYGATRKTIRDPEKFKYVRSTLFVAPVYCLIPGARGWGVMQFPVPVDDETTLFHNIQYCYDAVVDVDLLRAQTGSRIGIDFTETLENLRNRSNDWQQDRDAMSAGTSFSGIQGVMNEDIAVQESMGTIFDRTKEHLGTSDRAILHFRNMMLKKAQALRVDGTTPVHLDAADYGILRAEDRVMPIEESWLSVGAGGS